ncbi:hypothetical protein F4808DRAFT_452461 [Astrocystis sublimbata]|nr:hypothetical protein F4808DRAFT_454393 [Astrocystis sublimbata]KAI0193526.1 hypothetical protein F4808DRAFT_358126 [Astrocystis sublimbata]KAI0197702.1 hypothetical protein F4808DRAFT_452461 [Astrocystis sublimbata]
MAELSAHPRLSPQGDGEVQVRNVPAVVSDYVKSTGDTNGAIKAYLMERNLNFRTLSELRDKGWKNPAGDEYFAKQRHRADNSDDEQALRFFDMMKRVGQTVHRATGAFNIHAQPGEPTAILDMCMAPGGFLDVALACNPEAHAKAFSLPPEKGGHTVLIPPRPNIAINLVDITMLAADMDVETIPPEHPDACEFLARQFAPEDAFDIVICDGQVLRTHHREAYREIREPARLLFTQLALGLEHMKPGGTMLVLLHKIESWRCVLLLRTFSAFAHVRLFKQKGPHAKRSSCYLIASNVQPRHRDAQEAVRAWKMLWKVATFGTEEEYCAAVQKLEPGVEDVLGDFGETLLGLGNRVWETQAEALGRAPFVNGERAWRPGQTGSPRVVRN